MIKKSLSSKAQSMFVLVLRQNQKRLSAGQSMFAPASMMQNRHALGQSMFELIIALGVGVIIVTAVVIAASNSVRNSSFSKNNASATRYAQEGMEWLRGQRDQGWTTFSARASVSGTDWCLTTLSWPSLNGVCTSSQVIAGTTFKRQLTLKSKDLYPSGAPDNVSDTVEATMVVSWTQGVPCASGQSACTGDHNVTLTSQYTNWKAK